MTRYPEIKVQLSGEDGNAFSIISRVKATLRRAGVAKHELDEYVLESMSGDYDNLLRTASEWVTVK